MATSSSEAEPSSSSPQQEDEDEFITEPYIPEEWSLMSTFGVLLLFFTIVAFIMLTVLSRRRRRHLIRLERERVPSASNTSHGTKSAMTCCTPPGTIEVMEPTTAIQESEMPPPLQQAMMAAFPSDENMTAAAFPSDEDTYRSDSYPASDDVENPSNAKGAADSTDTTDKTKAKTVLSGTMPNLEQCATGEESDDTSANWGGFEMYFF